MLYEILLAPVILVSFLVLLYGEWAVVIYLLKWSQENIWIIIFTAAVAVPTLCFIVWREEKRSKIRSKELKRQQKLDADRKYSYQMSAHEIYMEKKRNKGKNKG
jgi:hypothetical protein